MMLDRPEPNLGEMIIRTCLRINYEEKQPYSNTEEILIPVQG